MQKRLAICARDGFNFVALLLAAWTVGCAVEGPVDPLVNQPNPPPEEPEPEPLPPIQPLAGTYHITHYSRVLVQDSTHESESLPNPDSAQTFRLVIVNDTMPGQEGTGQVHISGSFWIDTFTNGEYSQTTPVINDGDNSWTKNSPVDGHYQIKEWRGECGCEDPVPYLTILGDDSPPHWFTDFTFFQYEDGFISGMKGVSKVELTLLP